MHLTTRARRAWFGALATLCGVALNNPAHGQNQPVNAAPLVMAQAQNPQNNPVVAAAQQRTIGKPLIDERTGAVVVPAGSTVRFRMASGKPITKIINERQGLIQVGADPTDPAQVLITGLTPGITNLVLVDIDNKEETYKIEIATDVELLRYLIKKSVPTSNVEPIGGPSGVVVLTGNVAHADDVPTIMEIARNALPANARAVNGLTVGGVQQVQLDVVVASVNRSEARRRGFDFGIPGSNLNFYSAISGISVPAIAGGVGGIGGGAVPVGAPGALAQQLLPSPNANLVFQLLPSQVQLVIQALRDERLAKVVAEPRLVTLSGRPAYFLAGGRQATLGGAAGINGPGVAYEQIGSELEFLPLVLGNGKIYLEVAPRFRAVNQALGIGTVFGTVPGFDEQSVRTSVIMEPGQTFAIGGVISSNIQASAVRVPVLGDLPFVGVLFSRIEYSETETELVILVTPHLVDAQDCHQVTKKLPGRETRTPDDFELYLENVLEVPRGQRSVFVNNRYKAPFKNDPSASQFPCNHAGASRMVGCSTGNCTSGAIVAQPLLAPGQPMMMPSASTVPAAPSGNGTPAPTTPPGVSPSTGNTQYATPDALGSPTSTSTLESPRLLPYEQPQP